MIKNKEDDFLGDKISNNIKFADNEWQASGTVDRGSCYTKESILHLLFEGFDYQRNTGDYTLYVPRASTGEASIDFGDKSSAEIGAKAQHDLLLLDNNYYLITENSCEMNIFTVEAYLKKALALANPVYNEKARVKQIKLIDIEKADKIPISEFIGALNPLRFDSSITNPMAENYNKGFDLILNRYLDRTELGTYKEYSGKTLKQYLDDVKKKSSKLYQLFIDDFSLYYHDPDSILLPFNVRGPADKSTLENEPTEEKDFRTYFTRFINNVVTKTSLESVIVKPFYMETLNELVENSLYSNLSIPLYSGRASIDATLQTSEALGNEVLASLESSSIPVSNRYSHIIDLSPVNGNEPIRTLYQDFAQNIDEFPNPGAIASYVTPVYLGSTSTNKKFPKDSWGIHLMEEEDISRILQQDTEAFSIFNRLIVGYKLADALISCRTFLGGVYYILKEGWNSGLATSLRNTIPFRIRTVNTVFSKCSPGSGDSTVSLDYYPTILTINDIYRLGHGKTGLTPTPCQENSFNYEFEDEVKEWLSNECFILKAPVYGDYVEELNFQQDLNPDAEVTFRSLKIKKTSLDYERLQDSKYETPYLEQTAPLLNLTPDEDIGFGVYANDSFAAIGNLKGLDKSKSRKTIPPQFYDYDKDGDDLLGDNQYLDDDNDNRTKNKSGLKQRVTSSEGLLATESRIISPTIDEINTLLKYLIESDGTGVDSGFNERLPAFFGIKKSEVVGTLDTSPDLRLYGNSNRLNPLQTPDLKTEPYIDILGWKPIEDVDTEIFYTSKKCPEKQYGGYKVTRYIEKVYDYQVNIFGRRVTTKVDGDLYEFNTEVSNELNKVTGYLEKLFNEATLFFDLAEVGLMGTTKTPGSVDNKNLQRNPLDANAGDWFKSENDIKLITDNNPIHSTVERKKAFNDLSRILTWHKAKDGTNALDEGKETSYHNHFKEYLRNPKNLKEIERDLETIRQNLQALSEYVVASSANLGYADRGKNRGNLHQLHKNAYSFLSTWLVTVNNCYPSQAEDKYQVNVTLSLLGDTLNNTGIDSNGQEVDDLLVTTQDKKVVFDDGYFNERYNIENYDKFVIDLNSDPVQNTRNRHQMYRPNETLLSEVYLAADGTWRSVHEHTVLPVVYSDM